MTKQSSSLFDLLLLLCRYNDHHFHYGYVLYASAILGKKNPKFVSQYGSYVDSLFYDVAHNSSAISKHGDKGEVLFPFARHKSWFDGHSYATGLFEFANGKSQESSSEAVNCYYGAYLWSKVRWGGEASGSKSVDFARLLLATEMTGAKTYWHMAPPDDGNASGGLGKTVNSTTSADSEFTVDASSGTWKPPVPYNSIFQKNYMVCHDEKLLHLLHCPDFLHTFKSSFSYFLYNVLNIQPRLVTWE